MEQFLAHLWGDYILQNHWMSTVKTSKTSAALLHVLLYSVPFLAFPALGLPMSWQALSVIVGTHLIIDRFRITGYWCEFWGIGTSGILLNTLMQMRGYTREKYLGEEGEESSYWVPRDGSFKDQTKWLPVVADAPPYLKVWLFILVDNITHLTINYLALRGLT